MAARFQVVGVAPFSPYCTYNVVDSLTGKVLVNRESLTIAERIANRANDPSLDDFSESTEIARVIRQWAGLE